jgi:hypothetical protein
MIKKIVKRLDCDIYRRVQRVVVKEVKESKEEMKYLI